MQNIYVRENGTYFLSDPWLLPKDYTHCRKAASMEVPRRRLLFGETATCFRENVTNVEHDGVLWVWGRTEASGDAQSGTVGTWRRIPGVTFH